MSTRAHLYRPVLDSAGNIRTNVAVRILVPGTNTSLSETIYRTNEGTDSLGSQPINFPNGVIDFYLALPKRVRLGITAGAGAEVFFEDVDVLIPASTGTMASGVSYQPPPSLVASNVQDALNAIEAQVLDVNTRLTNHLDNQGISHDAHVISMTPNSTLTSTTVETALYELDTRIGAAPTLLIKTTNYTLALTDKIVFFNGVSLTGTLPTPVGNARLTYTIKNLNASPLTVTTSAGLIDGDVNRGLAQYDTITLISDGTNWGVI